MSVVIHSSIHPDIKNFFELFGEEIDECNPAAFDLLRRYIEEGEMKIFEDFVWFHIDELEACQPDAFDMIYEVCQKLDISL